MERVWTDDPILVGQMYWFFKEHGKSTLCFTSLLQRRTKYIEVHSISLRVYLSLVFWKFIPETGRSGFLN